MNIFLLILFLFSIQFIYKPNIDKIAYNNVQKHFNDIQKVSLHTNIPTDLISAIIYVESSGYSNAIGTSGEVGLMQVGDAALKDTGLLANLYNPFDNILVGTVYLKNLYLRSFSMSTAIRGYNQGLSRAKKDSTAGLEYLQKITKARMYFL